jgi:ATP-binding cassette subfamily C protein LapB
MNQMAELGRAEEFAPKDPIETCVLWLLEGLDKPMSAAALRASVARLPGPWTFEEAIEALESFGLRCRERSVSLSDLLSTHKSSIFLSEGAVVAAIQPKTEAHPAQLFVPTRNLRPTPLSVEALAMIYGGMVIEIEAELKIGTEDDNQKGRFGHWFFGPLLASKFVYFQVMMAALLTNIFALATSGFSMIVYDRVMPNGAMETLVALLVGVFIIFISDFVIRSLRSYFLDVAGAQADMVIADTLFEQVIDMELAARTSPTGSVANSLREFESLRDFLTSATLTTLIDLPFAVLFLFVIWTIGGPLVYVPLAAIPLIIGSTLLIQPSLRKLTQSNYEDGQTKNSVAIETLQGIETIKAIGAGSMMRKRWQDVISHQSTIGLKTRVLSQFSSNMSNFANQLVWVGTVTLGVYLTQTGAIGSGAIVACSMLSGRSIAPLAQLSQLLTRMNTALASYRNLSALMSQPREHKNKAAYLNRPVWQGSIEFRDVSFNYPGQSQGGLQNISFKIEAGEKVAIVGKVGSGKTTLAKLLVGLYKPSSGAILVDGIDIRQIDPADLRRNIGVVMQESWLFSGTVKQNIAVGGNNPTDEEILQAAMVSGVHEFISEHPDGYAYKLKEKGEGLSGGQRQTINIARALVGRPPILLMDEPTSAMDLGHESELIAKLKNQLINQTILIITHRTSILELATRVLVLDQGKIVAQGPKSDFMRNQPPQQAGQEAAAAY